MRDKSSRRVHAIIRTILINVAFESSVCDSRARSTRNILHVNARRKKNLLSVQASVVPRNVNGNIHLFVESCTHNTSMLMLERLKDSQFENKEHILGIEVCTCLYFRIFLTRITTSLEILSFFLKF